MADFVSALHGRIKSMASTHELLSCRKWQGIMLRELVERELAPYSAGSNVLIEGPAVVLRAEAGQAMAMVLHELVTNAAKYGALSTQRGHVSARWKGMAQESNVLVFEWRETGGPPVFGPVRTGYGTSVIRELIPYELGGTVDLELAPEGVRCRLEIPTAWLSRIDGPSPLLNGSGTVPVPATGFGNLVALNTAREMG